MRRIETAPVYSLSFAAGSYEMLPFSQQAVACFPHQAPDIHPTPWRFFVAHPFQPRLEEGGSEKE